MPLRILMMILVPVVLFLVCALIIMWLPLPQPFPAPLSGERTRMAAILVGVLGMGYLVGLIVYVTASFQQAGRILDPVLAPAGLDSKAYLLFGRRYHGPVQGRRVEVTYLPGQAMSRSQLNVYLDAALGTRIAIGRERPVLDCGDCPGVAVEAWEQVGFQVYAQDGAVARWLLADAEVSAALGRLLDERSGGGLRELYLQPERVWLRARPDGMSAEQFGRWFEDLLTLAAAGERALKPAQ